MSCQPQVVAGTNYLLELELECSQGTLLPGADAFPLEATIFQPLPYTNEGARITKLQVNLI
jgi:hypothetical protein